MTKVFLLFIICVVVLSVLGCSTEYNQIPFDSTKWKEDKEDYAIRDRMLSDLRRHYLNETLSREDIEKLLGHPDRILDKHNRPSGSPRAVFEYWEYELPLDKTSFDTRVFTVGFDYKGMYHHCYVFSN